MRPLPLLLALVLGAAAPPEAQTAPARPLLWRLADADSRVYLLGSVHALRPGTDVLPGAAAAAYDEADVVAFEIDFDDARASGGLAASLGVATDGLTLSKRLGPADAARLARRLEAGGLSLATVETVEPWLVSLLLLTVPGEAGTLSAQAGVDAVLYARAAADGKPRLGLETMADQIGAFDGLPMKDQLAMLRSALADGGEASEQAALVDAWTAGDEAALVGLLERGLGATAAMRRRILTDRNARWVPQIRMLLDRQDAEGRPQDVLVVVGAGHLVGPGSVVEMLRSDGVAVERID